MSSISHTLLFALFVLLLVSCSLLFYQYSIINDLRRELSEYSVNAQTMEVVRYHYLDEDIDSSVICERAYEDGYSDAEGNMIRYYDDYIGTDEFFNDYGFETIAPR